MAIAEGLGRPFSFSLMSASLLAPEPVRRASPRPVTVAPTPARSLPVFRYVIFTALNVAMIYGIWLMARVGGTSLFSEGSRLEWTQFSALVAVAGLFFIAATRLPSHRQLHVLLGVAACLGGIRELDAYFDRWLPGLGWQLPFWCLLLSAGAYAWRGRAALRMQLREFTSHRAFAFMWCAFILAAPFGQMIGHGAFLQELFGEDYRRPMKRVIEESAETLGYLWVLLASMDWLIDRRSDARVAARG